MRRQRGSALVLTLAVLAGLVGLIGVLESSHAVTMRGEMNRFAQRRAELMAESGIQRAIAELQSQKLGQATQGDPWFQLGESGATEFQVGPDSFRVQVIDSSSKINLNSADHDTLAKLPLSSDQVDCLMDWREKATNSRPAGAKDDYYNALPKPYNTKLQTLGSIDELLQVKGFTPNMVYGPGQTALTDLATTESVSGDLDPNGKQKLDITTATSDQLIAIGVSAQIANALIQSQGSFQKLGDVISVQGVDQATAKIILNNCQIGTKPHSSGLVNLNTASSAVLSAIPNLDPDVASSIQERQSTGFGGLGDLVDIPGLSLSALAKVVDKFCVSSRSFEIRCIGFAAGLPVAYQAFVSIGDDGTVTTYRVQPAPFVDAASRWNWPSATSDRVILAGVW